MYELSVETTFCSAHALVIAGALETIHGHNFHLTLTVAGDRLDSDGLLVDFHALEALVHSIVRPFINANLGAVPPFDTVNPSAENIARHIAHAVQERLPTLSHSPTTLRVRSARVTEAPGCSVTYFP